MILIHRPSQLQGLGGSANRHMRSGSKLSQLDDCPAISTPAFAPMWTEKTNRMETNLQVGVDDRGEIDAINQQRLK